MDVTEADVEVEGRPRRRPNVTLKQALEVLVALAVLAGTVLTVHSQNVISDKNAEIDRLEAQLGSMERSVGEPPTFDLEQMLTDGADRRGVPESYDYVAEDEFYVSPSVAQDWSLSRVSERDYMLSAGMSEAVVPAALADIELSVWRRSTEHVTIEDPAGQLLMNVYTSVTLERTTPDELFGAFYEQYGPDTASTDLIASLEDLAAEDFTSFVVQTQLATQPPIMPVQSDADVGTILQTIKKPDAIPRARGAAYAQLATSFRNVEVDGIHFDQYFIVQEMIVFDLGSDVILISTRVPTPDQTSVDFSHVTTLLNSLRIVAAG